MNLEQEDLDEVIDQAYDEIELKAYRNSQAVFHLGESTTYFYILVKGQVTAFIPKTEKEIEYERNQSRRILEIENTIKSFVDENELKLLMEELQKLQTERNTRSEKEKLLQNFKSSQNYYSQVDNIYLFEQVTIYSVGDCFGEISFLIEQPRQQTIIATGSVLVARIDKESYTKIFWKQKINLEFAYNNLYKQFPLANKYELAKMSYKMILKKFKRLQVIFKEGDDIDGFYLVKKGSVQLLKNRQRTTLSLSIVPEDQIFGLEDIITKNKRNYSVQADSFETLVYFFPKKHFKFIYDTLLCRQIKKLSDNQKNYLSQRLQLIEQFDTSQQEKQQTSKKLTHKRKPRDLFNEVIQSINKIDQDFIHYDSNQNVQDEQDTQFELKRKISPQLNNSKQSKELLSIERVNDIVLHNGKIMRKLNMMQPKNSFMSLEMKSFEETKQHYLISKVFNNKPKLPKPQKSRVDVLEETSRLSRKIHSLQSFQTIPETPTIYNNTSLSKNSQYTESTKKSKSHSSIKPYLKMKESQLKQHLKEVIDKKFSFLLASPYSLRGQQ